MVAKLLPFPVGEFDEDEEEDEDDRAEDGACVFELGVDVCELRFICEMGVEGFRGPVDDDTQQGDHEDEGLYTCRHHKDLQVDDNDNNPEKNGSAELQISQCAQTVQDVSFEDIHIDEHGDNSEENGEADAFQEHGLIEMGIGDAGGVELG